MRRIIIRMMLYDRFHRRIGRTRTIKARANGITAIPLHGKRYAAIRTENERVVRCSMKKIMDIFARNGKLSVVTSAFMD